MAPTTIIITIPKWRVYYSIRAIVIYALVQPRLLATAFVTTTATWNVLAYSTPPPSLVSVKGRHHRAADEHCFSRTNYMRCKLLRLSSTISGPSEFRIDDELDEDEEGEAIVDQSSFDDSVLSPEDYESLPEGLPKGFYVDRQYKFAPESIVANLSSVWCTPTTGSQSNDASIVSSTDHMDRLALTHDNVTLPVALMMLDPISYPSLSRARKACRKGNILVQRRNGQIEGDCTNANATSDQTGGTNPLRFIGRVGDRIYPYDMIGHQVRMGNGYFSVVGHKPPPFVLPVVYQDDHMALVNKPAGVVCYRQGSGHTGLLSVRAALPFVLTPPARGTYAVLRRPASVHRLDKPTSGLLCVVKTKPAMISMSKQFHDRIVQKTYMAIVNGIPQEESERSITSVQAKALGVDIDVTLYPPDTRWQLTDAPLDDKHAVTVWRAVTYVPSLHAMDQTLTLVELKPKTGRYHQLRRHLAWHCHRPIVGDDTYDGGTPAARKFRDRGLFLCATRVTHEHPYFNSAEGRVVWDELDDNKYANGTLWMSSATNKVMLSTCINLPDKFQSLLSRENDRYLKLSTEHDES